jgi:GNAT superfamily N-acetyltransferase
MEQLLLTDPTDPTDPEPIEREAYCDLFTAAGSPELRRRLGLSAERCGPALVLRSRVLDHVLFNRALGLQRGGADADALAESVVARYRAQGIARYVMQVDASEGPCALCDRLQALGLRKAARRWHKLARGRDEVMRAAVIEEKSAVSTVAVERAGAADAQAIGAALADGLQLPEVAALLFARVAQSARWHGYVARDDDGDADAGLLMYADGRRACLALMATKRARRGRDVQGALITRAVQDALDLGCSELSAETREAVPGQPEAVHHALTHAGFRVVEAYDCWTPGRPNVA